MCRFLHVYTVLLRILIFQPPKNVTGMKKNDRASVTAAVLRYVILIVCICNTTVWLDQTLSLQII